MTKSRSVVAPEHIKGKRDDKGHTRKPLGRDGTTPPNVHRGSTSLSWYGNFAPSNVDQNNNNNNDNIKQIIVKKKHPVVWDNIDFSGMGRSESGVSCNFWSNVLKVWGGQVQHLKDAVESPSMTPINLLVHIQVAWSHKDINRVVRKYFAGFDKNDFSLLAKSQCETYYLKPTSRVKMISMIVSKVTKWFFTEYFLWNPWGELDIISLFPSTQRPIPCLQITPEATRQWWKELDRYGPGIKYASPSSGQSDTVFPARNPHDATRGVLLNSSRCWHMTQGLYPLTKMQLINWKTCRQKSGLWL